MLLLTAEKTKKSYSEKILLNDIVLGINNGETPDSGSVTSPLPPNRRLGIAAPIIISPASSMKHFNGSLQSAFSSLHA